MRHENHISKRKEKGLGFDFFIDDAAVQQEFGVEMSYERKYDFITYFFTISLINPCYFTMKYTKTTH